ncbi:MAG: hypothetical protein AAF570_19190, partial [Bacteroidota bacterium]
RRGGGVVMLDQLSPNHGSRRPRKRVGRGIGSGWGKTCGRCKEPAVTRPDPPAGEFALGGADNELGRGILETSDGGFLIVGTQETEETEGYDMMLMKVDANGGEVWTRTYPGSLDEVAHAILPYGTGYAIGGISGAAQGGIRYFKIAVLDEDFEVLRENTYPIPNSSYSNTNLSGFYETADGGFLLATVVQRNPFLLRVDLNLNRISDESFFDLFVLEAGQMLTRRPNSNGFLLASSQSSYYSGYSGGNRLNFIGLDENGEVLWAVATPDLTDGLPRVMGIVANSDSTYLLNLFQENSSNWLYEVDSVGNVLRELEKSENGEWNGVVLTSDGGNLLVGYEGLNYGYRSDGRGYAMKSDSNLATQWARLYGGDGIDRLYSGIETSDGRIVLVGSTTSYGEDGTNVYLIFANP